MCPDVDMTMTRVTVTAVEPRELQFYDNAGVISHTSHTSPVQTWSYRCVVISVLHRPDQETNHRHRTRLRSEN